MLSDRPFFYLSLSGVALMFGVFWLRRRNKNNIRDNDVSPGDKEVQNTVLEVNANETTKIPSHVRSNSVNINGSAVVDNDENNASKIFGKSAPIRIVQNSRCPPSKQQIDSEELKTKIQDVELKQLRSIDEDFENLSSPVDLPDSVTRVPFHARRVPIQKDEPVVIKATNTPKISPENSFLESKYIKECEQSNCKSDPLKIENDADKISHMKQEECEKSTLPISDVKSVMNTGSPSLSVCSEQSGDSGKGSSLPRSEATRAKTTYEFFFPNSLVGQLYGRNRSFINQIKAKTGANVILRKTRYSAKVRVCIVEGTEKEIDGALAMIRQRIPNKRYPHFTMQRIHFAEPQTVVPLSVESILNLELHLIEAINNDVVVSAVLSGGHIFVQQPLHPSHPSLAVLQKYLYDYYTTSEAPLLPSLEISAVCVVPVNGIWYRVQIVEQDAEEEQRCIVKFLDFGGYMNVHFNDLRQIRSDFMGVPFQATECVLSNIEPAGSSWSPEATDILCQLTKGNILQAQVAGYNSQNVPEIYLFASLGRNNIIFINKEMVARNLARWVEVKN